MASSSRRPSKGKQKIEIKPIENSDARQVCFSKRRSGIFKKANELSILCGAEVAVVVFSPGGRPFSFGHPSVEAIVDRFISGGPASPQPHALGVRHEAPPRNSVAVQELERQAAELAERLEAEKRRKVALVAELRMVVDANVDELRLDQLERLKAALEWLQHDLAVRANQSMMEAQQASYLVVSGSGDFGGAFGHSEPETLMLAAINNETIMLPPPPPPQSDQIMMSLPHYAGRFF